jgi:mRNA-degrading endonuclease RelE of RelBE toxin-antitoxin system
MASYKLVFEHSVAKDLRRIPDEDVVRILERVEMLAADPTGRAVINSRSGIACGKVSTELSAPSTMKK